MPPVPPPGSATALAAHFLTLKLAFTLVSEVGWILKRKTPTTGPLNLVSDCQLGLEIERTSPSGYNACMELYLKEANVLEDRFSVL